MNSNNPAIERKNIPTVEAVPRENHFHLTTMSFTLAAAGISLIVWAGLSDDFRRDENVLTARFCLPLAAGAALIINGAFVNSRVRNVALLFGLALVGQAAALQLIDAGRLIHFQHYRSFAASSASDVLPLILILLQTGAVAFGIWRNRAEIIAWFKQNLTIRRLIFAAALLMLAGAAVTPDVSIYATSLLLAAIVQTVNLANVWLSARAVPNETIAQITSAFAVFFEDSNQSQKNRLDKFSIGAAAGVVVLAGFLSYFVYENHPHVPDETQYLFQAKYFAAGQLTVEAPLVSEPFAMYMTPRDEARWFSIFPPGWSAILAVGVKANVQWLVNPLLAGICVLLLYLFLQGIYSRKFARLAVMLVCCSPWFVFMAMSLMSHTATLAAALAAAVLLQTAIRNQNAFYVFAAGLLLGILSLIRPIDAAIVAVLLGIWTFFKFSGWKTKAINSLILIAGTILTAGLILPYNRAVTGNAFLSPMDFYYAKYFPAGAMSYGFGATRGFGWGLDAYPGHSPAEAVVNAALNVFQTNTELFGWACGSLIFIVWFFVSGNLGKKDFWAIAVLALVIIAYGFFWYHGGPDFGARYWFMIIVPLVALTVRGIERFGCESVESASESNFNLRVVCAVLMLSAMSLVNYMPWRALDKYYRYLEMQPDVQRLAEEYSFGRSLVLIRGAEHPDYQSAWIYNPVNFNGDAPIFARDVSPHDTAHLWCLYADRPLWVIDPPTRTGNTYRIVKGPIYAEQIWSENNR